MREEAASILREQTTHSSARWVGGGLESSPDNKSPASLPGALPSLCLLCVQLMENEVPEAQRIERPHSGESRTVTSVMLDWRDSYPGDWHDLSSQGFTEALFECLRETTQYFSGYISELTPK